MQLLTSWKDCLFMGKPENAKLFGLVTLNACLHTYRSICHFFLPFLLCLLFSVWYTGMRWFILPVLLLFIYMFMIYLAARPSTLRKDWYYFVSYTRFWVWFSLFFLFWLCMLCSLWSIGFPSWFSALPLYAPLFPFFSITIAFLCDSDGSACAALLSVWRAFLFVCYNFPLCLLFSALFIGSAHLLFLFLPTAVAVVLLVLLWPLVICTYINLYIKRVHEQFSLYFGH